MTALSGLDDIIISGQRRKWRHALAACARAFKWPSRQGALVGLGVLGVSLWGTGGWAQDAIRSIVTTVDLKSCRVLKHGLDGSAWRCAGLAGYPVQIADSDDRTFFSAGVKPEQRRASQQTLNAFNTIFPPGSTRATIEWRVARGGGHVTPYATIIRYYTARDGAKGQVLVVSRVSADQTCQVAMIDALANADAIERARRVADVAAREFDCSKPPTIEGAQGKSPM